MGVGAIQSGVDLAPFSRLGAAGGAADSEGFVFPKSHPSSVQESCAISWSIVTDLDEKNARAFADGNRGQNWRVPFRMFRQTLGEKGASWLNAVRSVSEGTVFLGRAGTAAAA
jgi:hypothetical protein